MINILLAVLFALGLVTSGGITVAASQDATPEDVLYPVRTFVEDTRLTLADEDGEGELALEYAEKYMEQMKHELANKGEISGPFVNRFAEMFARANGWANELPDTASEDARTPDPARQFSGELNPTDPGPKGKDATTVERLQTLVETTQELTVTGAIDPVGVMIQKHDRDRINDNANEDQPRFMYQNSMPGTDTDGDGIIDEPAIQGNGAGTPCEVDADGDGTFEATGYYCYLVYHPIDGGWYWYYGTDPYSADGTQPLVTSPRFPTVDLGPGPGPGSSNGTGGSKK